MKIDRTIISLAILKVNWDRKKEDFIENFVPFIATLINKKKYNELTPEIITSDFSAEFGINIPIEPIITILERCTKRGILEKSSSRTLLPKWDVINKYDFADRQIEQERRQNKVIIELQKFVKETFNDDITKEDIQETIIEYFKQHDMDILFSAYQHSLLPDVKSDKKNKFFVYKFIQKCSETEPEIFSYIVDLAIGHALANTIMYQNEYRNYEGNLSSLTVYLDIQFILRLSGVEGEYKRASILQFIDGIIEKKGTVKVFQHTHDEALGILNGTKVWIQNKSYDKSKSNIATQYFVENSKTHSDVDMCISQLDTLLRLKRISIAVAPDRNELKRYLISEQELNEKIISKYKEDNPHFNEEGKEMTIYKDITSISSIYILRRNERPRNIKNAHFIFVTTNGSLAMATRQFEHDNYNNTFVIPACITHVLLGTAIWLDNPVQLTQFNKLKMIADCVAALNPSRELSKHYLSEIEKVHKAGRITEEEYFYMKSDKYVYELLENKTYGIDENFTAKTAEEILNETIFAQKQEGSEQLEAQKQLANETLEKAKHEHLQTQFALQEIVEQTTSILAISEKIAVKIANIISYGCYIIILLFIILAILCAPPFELFKHSIYEYIFFIGSTIFILIHVINGFHVKKMRKYIFDKIYSFIIKLLTGKQITKIVSK